MEDFVPYLVVGWFCSAIVGAIIGASRNMAAAGFFLGLFFGPLGAIATFALDGRLGCPQCGNKIDWRVRMCPVCRTELEWHRGGVSTKEQCQRWEQQRDRRK